MTNTASIENLNALRALFGEEPITTAELAALDAQNAQNAATVRANAAAAKALGELRLERIADAARPHRYAMDARNSSGVRSNYGE